MKFSDLDIIPSILKALAKEWYESPTPIQEKSIPLILQGKDVMWCAQTGTGKTASFAIPILQLLHNAPKDPKTADKIKTLILTPTRELAIQIWESFAAYGADTGIRHTVIFGGVGQSPQVKAIRKWVDVVIATPGRLLDLMQQKHISLAHLSIFVLDEADRMLDMWFIHDIKKVLKTLPNRRQSLFFSATMPPVIMELAHTILKDPIKVVVSPISSTVQTVQQSLYFVEKADKRELLVHLLKDTSIESALVFTRTKHGADKVMQVLMRAGIPTAAIHGNKSQTARQNALANLKDKKIRVLVATDIAARGIDINELSHVFIYDIPTEPETYVHRIGRTGRAGATGVAIAFCDSDEKKYLKQIVAVIKQDIPVVEDHPYKSTGRPSVSKTDKPRQDRVRPTRSSRPPMVWRYWAEAGDTKENTLKRFDRPAKKSDRKPTKPDKLEKFTSPKKPWWFGGGASASRGWYAGSNKSSYKSAPKRAWWQGGRGR